MTDPSPAEQRWREQLSRLSVWQRGDERAVHKPLLTLMLIKQAVDGGDGVLRYADVDEPLRGLLREFGPPRKSFHPEFPFWYLQSDGFWSVDDARSFEKKKGGSSPTKSTLLKRDATGRVPPDLWAELRQNPRLQSDLVELLLSGYWPETYHDAIRSALGLGDLVAGEVQQALRRRRDPAFRENVLRAYRRQCAMCGYDGRLGDTLLGLEAAHIKWHAVNGPDEVANGLALCSLHHVALDRGAIGIDDGLRWMVSADVNGSTQVPELLYRYQGQAIIKPQAGFAPPAQAFSAWHRREVFRGEGVRVG